MPLNCPGRLSHTDKTWGPTTKINVKETSKSKNSLGDMSSCIVQPSTVNLVIFWARLSFLCLTPCLYLVWEPAISGEMSAVCGEAVIGFAGTEP